MKKLLPSLLSANFIDLKNDIDLLIDNGIEILHFDVMDGRFVPNITVGPLVLNAINKNYDLILDCHLMIVEPEKYVDDFIKAGADIITFHYESTIHHHRLIHHIKSKGIKAGISINPSTPVHILEPILGDIDLVLVMSVNPGFGGQSFIPISLEKLEYLKKYKSKNNLDYIIEIDGGVNSDNINNISSLGAEYIVAGSAVFNGNIKNNIKCLTERM